MDSRSRRDPPRPAKKKNEKPENSTSWLFKPFPPLVFLSRLSQYPTMKFMEFHGYPAGRLAIWLAARHSNFQNVASPDIRVARMKHATFCPAQQTVYAEYDPINYHLDLQFAQRNYQQKQNSVSELALWSWLFGSGPLVMALWSLPNCSWPFGPDPLVVALWSWPNGMVRFLRAPRSSIVKDLLLTQRSNFRKQKNLDHRIENQWHRRVWPPTLPAQNMIFPGYGG